MRPRQFVPPGFIAGLLGSALLVLLWPSSRWIFLAIVVAYLVASLTATIYTAFHKGWKYVPLLPFVFAILHLSYGLGFLVGLFHFANRWGDRQGKVPRIDIIPIDGAHA